MENLGTKQLRTFLEDRPSCADTRLAAIKLAYEWGLPVDSRPDFLEFLAEYLQTTGTDPTKPEESTEWQDGYMTAMEQVRDAWQTYSNPTEED